MNSVVVSVMNKDILFETDMDITPIIKYFRQGNNPDLKLIYTRSTSRKIADVGRAGFFKLDKQYPKEYQCIICRKEDDYIGIHEASIMLAYLAGINSERYNSVHGCGMMIRSDNKERGILVVGMHGSGKTTLSERLGNGRTLDDDIMMIDDTRMYTVGIHGAMTYKDEHGQKYRKHQENGMSEANIDTVFILDKNEDGGYIREVEWNIPRINSVFDILEPSLNDAYISMPSIRVNVPVYKIGTRNDIHETKKVVMSVI